MTDPCQHLTDAQLRLEGGIYTYCTRCGALKRNGEKVWTRPGREDRHHTP